MFKIELWSLTFLSGVAGGAAGLWILQNGWGKFLALYHARADRAAAQTKELYSEVKGQLDSLLAPIAADVATLKTEVAALKNKPAA